MVNQENYDDLISQHYDKVASEEGDKSTSTMADIVTRQKETSIILNFVEKNLAKGSKKGSTAQISDVGCGNGYTLDVLSQKFPGLKLLGIEKNENLRNIAISRFQNNPNVKIIEGDIRDSNFSSGIKSDILICQRVLINLLNENDQKSALNNLIKNVNTQSSFGTSGKLLFLESFTTPLENLNEARSEFDLAPIKMAHHNLYLKDNFFDVANLKVWQEHPDIFPQNFLSTHYFVTRVLHSIFTANKSLKRNSQFVSFFTQALKDHVGDFSPLKLQLFEKI